jgi:O-antigen/teichoic acid export membrane protein
MLADGVALFYKSPKFRKFFIYGIGQAVNLVSPLLVVPHVLHVVGESGLGKVGVGMSLAYILIVLVDYSSYIKGVREVSLSRYEPTQLRGILAKVYLAKTILMAFIAVSVLAACFVVPYFGSDKALIFFSVFIILGQYLNPTWFFQGTESFLSISVINVISKVIYVAGVFAFINLPGDYIYVNFWLGIGFVIPSVAAALWIFRKYGVGLSDFSLKAAIGLIRDDFSFCLSQLLFAFRQYSPIMIVSFFAGDIVAGQYKVIEQIVMLFRTYFQTIFKFSYSIVSYEINHIFAKGLSTWRKINGYNLLLGAIALAVIYWNSGFVLHFFKVTEAYLPLYHSLLGIALFLPLLVGVTLAQEQLMFSLDKNTEYIKITIFITAFSTVSIIAWLWLSGLQGVFISLLITEALLAAVYHKILRTFYMPGLKQPE